MHLLVLSSNDDVGTHSCRIFVPRILYKVAYTLNALCQSNKQSYPCDDIDPAQHLNIIHTAEEAVANTNEAYINSGIETQLRLVYVHYTSGINDSSHTCGSIIGAFQRNGDGLMDEVHDKRNEWGADFLALLPSSAVSGCGGVAYLGPYQAYMYSVTLAPYARGGTFGYVPSLPIYFN